jgi:hypothetical protein
MGIFEAVEAASNVSAVLDLISNASRVLTDPTSSSEEKKDASKAKRLGDKKVAAQKNKAKGGVVSKMAYGGMAHGKKHMYLGGNASVKDNAGLRALKKSSPEAYMNIVKNVK